MEIGEVFHPRVRQEWRDWLACHHASGTEVWVRRCHRSSGEPSISYDELVEECLCFGWIDGLAKKYDEISSVQRTCPRRPRSYLSELNRQRIWKLRLEDRMTEAGETVLAGRVGTPEDAPPFPDRQWIDEAIAADPEAAAAVDALPALYRRLRIGYIAELRGPSRRPEAEKRLAHFLRQTKAGKRYGTEPLRGLLYE